MKRGFSSDSVWNGGVIHDFQGFWCENEDPPKRNCISQQIQYPLYIQEKRYYEGSDGNQCKRVCLQSQREPTLPSVKLYTDTLEFPPQWNARSTGIPQSFIQKMEEEAYKYGDPFRFPRVSSYRQTREYRNQSITLYSQPQTIDPQGSSRRTMEDEDLEDEDLGVISYYYPLNRGSDNPSVPINESNFMEIVTSPLECDNQSEPVDYHNQMMETGLRGVRPMDW